jgi:flagellar hook-length control protein FliK
MPQSFNVQMNTQHFQKIQREQSGTPSQDSPGKDSENHFNSILQTALPKEPNVKASSSKPSTDELSSTAGATKTSEEAGEPLLLSDDQDLKSRISALLEFFDIGSSNQAASDDEASEQVNQEQTGLLGDMFTNEDVVELLNKFSSTDSAEESLAPLAKEIRSTAFTQQERTNINNLASALAKTLPGDLTQLTESSLSQNTPLTLTKEQTAFLEKIQNILNNSSEIGTLSIKSATELNNGSPLRSHFAAIIEVQAEENIASPLTTGKQSDNLTSLQEGVFGPTLNSRQTSLHSIRHDSTQHFYDAKVQPENGMKDTGNPSGNQQNSEMSQPGSGFGQLGTTPATSDGTSTFSLSGSSLMGTGTGQLADIAKTTVLPSGVVVQDQEVLQQFVERFQLSRKDADTKIQLKLHPAELGEMKIDLTVKEGSIRANVVAQSQHVQQILERNLTKLKSTLEQQGFNVEEITVTTASEMVDSSDLFNQQLPNRDFSGFFSQDKKAASHTPFILDAFQEQNSDVTSGVNVKV